MKNYLQIKFFIKTKEALEITITQELRSDISSELFVP